MRFKNIQWVSFSCLLFFMLGFSSCENNKVEDDTLGTISGVVKKGSNAEAMEGVSITTNPPSSAPITDVNGNFILENVPVGDVVVTSKKEGYKNAVYNVAVQAGQNTPATIVMEEVISSHNIEIEPVEPKDVAEEQGLTIKLVWTVDKPKNEEVTYRLKVFKAGNDSEIYNEGNLSDTTYTIKDLEFFTTYFWSVQAYVDGDLTYSSPTWRFTTKEVGSLPIVFARKEDDKYHIYLSDTIGEDVYRIPANSEASDWSPQFNNAGSAIAFVSTRNHEPKLYLSNGVGANPIQVSSIPVVGYNNYGQGYCWSPDDRYFLICSYDKLYRVDVNGANLTVIATAPQGRNFKHCDWNEVTRKIVVETSGQSVYDTEFYLMDENGANMTLLIGTRKGRMDNPTFSIDGKKIMYSYDVSQFENSSGRQLDAKVYIYDIATGEDENVSDLKLAGTNDIYPRYSPNGAWVIMVNTDNSGMGIEYIYGGQLSLNTRYEWIIDGTTPDWRP